MRPDLLLVLVRVDWKQGINRYFKENDKLDLVQVSFCFITFIWEMTDAAFSRNVSITDMNS